VKVVVDACFAGAWLLPDESSRRADKLLKRFLESQDELCVPQLWIYEISNLLLSAERRKRISREQVQEAHELLDSVRRTTFDQEPLLVRQRITNFARSYALSAYDAAYLELADRLQCDLATLDKSLQKAAAKVRRRH
jgi:predicted nucleic acid-binding protein